MVASMVSMKQEENLAGRAVDALLKWVSSRPKYQKAQLFDHDEFLYIIVTFTKIPPNPRTSPFKILLPNPLFPFDGSLQTCLIIDDRAKSLDSKTAKQKIEQEGIPVSKVLKFSKLKTDYRPFEARRKLCGSYDLFFADKRVIPLLPRLLGKSFFKKKKIPIPIDLGHKNWKEQMQNACNSTFLFLRTGTCSVLKVGKVSQARDEIIENVLAAMERIVEIVPKKWEGVRSFHLKFLESVALPIYQKLPANTLKIDTGFPKANSQPAVEEKVPENNADEEKEEPDNKKKTKKGRIHQVHYMDSISDDSHCNAVVDEDRVINDPDEGRIHQVCQLNSVPDDSHGNDVVDEDRIINEADEEKEEPVKKKKKKKAKKENIQVHYMDSVPDDPHGNDVIDGDHVINADEEKEEPVKKKKKTKKERIHRDPNMDSVPDDSHGNGVPDRDHVINDADEEKEEPVQKKKKTKKGRIHGDHNMDSVPADSHGKDVADRGHVINDADEEKEEPVKKKKTTKKGRIHEVQDMDSVPADSHGKDVVVDGDHVINDAYEEKEEPLKKMKKTKKGRIREVHDMDSVADDPHEILPKIAKANGTKKSSKKVKDVSKTTKDESRRGKQGKTKDPK